MLHHLGWVFTKLQKIHNESYLNPEISGVAVGLEYMVHIVSLPKYPEMQISI
jgi:hypothetical protein